MKTYAPKRLYDEITSRPDWPEIERGMKNIYGDTWKLVPTNDRIMGPWREIDDTGN